MRGLVFLLVLLPCFALAAGYDADALSSPQRALAEAHMLIGKGDSRTAANLLDAANRRYPNNFALLMEWGESLYNTGRFGEAEIRFKHAKQLDDTQLVEAKLSQIDQKLQSFAQNLNEAVIEMQRNTDAGNYDTSIAIGDRAIARFPRKDILYKERGDALYRKGDLSDADASLRTALQINPFNREAQQLVENIRDTEQAQVSTSLAEWIGIAKDKLGDFVVTFLALFMAFVVNTMVDPLILRFKLNGARRHFERGDYDRLVDLIEGMYDLENFAPLRSTLRFILRQKSYEDSKLILNKYVMTVERLPTLLRILEREHEKMLESDG